MAESERKNQNGSAKKNDAKSIAKSLKSRDKTKRSAAVSLCREDPDLLDDKTVLKYLLLLLERPKESKVIEGALDCLSLFLSKHEIEGSIEKLEDLLSLWTNSLIAKEEEQIESLGLIDSRDQSSTAKLFTHDNGLVQERFVTVILTLVEPLIDRGGAYPKLSWKFKEENRSFHQAFSKFIKCTGLLNVLAQAIQNDRREVLLGVAEGQSLNARLDLISALAFLARYEVCEEGSTFRKLVWNYARISWERERIEEQRAMWICVLSAVGDNDLLEDTDDGKFLHTLVLQTLRSFLSEMETAEQPLACKHFWNLANVLRLLYHYLQYLAEHIFRPAEGIKQEVVIESLSEKQPCIEVHPIFECIARVLEHLILPKKLTNAKDKIQSSPDWSSVENSPGAFAVMFLSIKTVMKFGELAQHKNWSGLCLVQVDQQNEVEKGLETSPGRLAVNKLAHATTGDSPRSTVFEGHGMNTSSVGADKEGNTGSLNTFAGGGKASLPQYVNVLHMLVLIMHKFHGSSDLKYKKMAAAAGKSALSILGHYADTSPDTMHEIPEELDLWKMSASEQATKSITEQTERWESCIACLVTIMCPDALINGVVLRLMLTGNVPGIQSPSWTTWMDAILEKIQEALLTLEHLEQPAETFPNLQRKTAIGVKANDKACTNTKVKGEIRSDDDTDPPICEKGKVNRSAPFENQEKIGGYLRFLRLLNDIARRLSERGSQDLSTDSNRYIARYKAISSYCESMIDATTTQVTESCDPAITKTAISSSSGDLVASSSKGSDTSRSCTNPKLLKTEDPSRAIEGVSVQAQSGKSPLFDNKQLLTECLDTLQMCLQCVRPRAFDAGDRCRVRRNNAQGKELQGDSAQIYYELLDRACKAVWMNVSAYVGGSGTFEQDCARSTTILRLLEEILRAECGKMWLLSWLLCRCNVYTTEEKNTNAQADPTVCLREFMKETSGRSDGSPGLSSTEITADESVTRDDSLEQQRESAGNAVEPTTLSDTTSETRVADNLMSIRRLLSLLVTSTIDDLSAACPQNFRSIHILYSLVCGKRYMQEPAQDTLSESDGSLYDVTFDQILKLVAVEHGVLSFIVELSSCWRRTSSHIALQSLCECEGWYKHRLNLSVTPAASIYTRVKEWCSLIVEHILAFDSNEIVDSKVIPQGTVLCRTEDVSKCALYDHFLKLLSRKYPSVLDGSRAQMTPLRLCCVLSLDTFGKQLISNGVSIASEASEQPPLLLLAISHNMGHTVREMLRKGKVPLYVRDAVGYTALSHAILVAVLHFLDEFIPHIFRSEVLRTIKADRGGAGYQTVFDEGSAKASNTFQLKNSHLRMLIDLLQAGMDPDFADSYQQSAAHFLLVVCKEIEGAFVSASCSENSRQGRSESKGAVKDSSKSLVHYWVRQLVQSALHDTAALKHNEAKSYPTLELRLDNDQQWMTDDRLCQLRSGIQIFACLALSELVGHFADLDQFNGWGQTPLHLAVLFSLPQTATHLLSLGANPNTCDDFGFLALHYAAAGCPSDSIGMMEKLLEAGAGSPYIYHSRRSRPQLGSWSEHGSESRPPEALDRLDHSLNNPVGKNSGGRVDIAPFSEAPGSERGEVNERPLVDKAELGAQENMKMQMITSSTEICPCNSETASSAMNGDFPSEGLRSNSDHQEERLHRYLSESYKKAFAGSKATLVYPTTLQLLERRVGVGLNLNVEEIATQGFASLPDGIEFESSKHLANDTEQERENRVKWIKKWKSMQN